MLKVIKMFLSSQVEGLTARSLVASDRMRAIRMLSANSDGGASMRHNSSSGDENSPNSGSPNFQNGFHG